MSHGKPYTIGRLAEVAGVATTTIRFYERRGLIHPEGRSRGNYRVYSEDSVEQLRFIKAAKDAGFTIENIRLLLDLKDESAPPSSEVETLVARRLEAVRGQIEQLRRAETVLDEWLNICRAAQQCGRCGVLDELEASAQAPSAPVTKTSARRHPRP